MNKCSVEKKTLVNQILNRGVIKQILPSEEEFRELLLSDKKLKIYIGADPTGDSLHLSHAKNFLLLEEFRQLGHEVFVLFGDLTACIGDPSEKSSARSKLTRATAKKNAESWVNQISSLINFNCEENPAQVVYNSTWFDEFSVTELLELFSNSTVQQMIERDMFQKRISSQKPIFLNEFLYPMFQGYDSVALDVDVELCGTDQIFNALAGRDLLKKFKDKDKFVVAVNLMENPKNGTLMSKTNKTGVFLGTDPKTLFGQIMAQPDEMIEVILVNNTRISLDEIKKLDILNNPMKAKLFTAQEITKIFYGPEAAIKEYESFINTFSKKTFSKDAEIIESNQKEISLMELIIHCMPNESKSNVRRLIIQKAVSVNGEKIEDEEKKFDLEKMDELKIKIGKKRFYEVVYK
ncbi:MULTISPECIES: tyrosine--tRNA ligase [unclassified Exiguobacterium]|uniref:tyrosine--tRNA ligase n=1 Tax=unclassified Exiguobacterium TaxID=2644629 RepID=UPI001BE75493|nr:MULTISPECIES: tyrosine--tRNA ligase [unclassified Exiguobacterium]